MAGMVTTPEVITFEITLPLIEPCNALEMIADLRGAAAQAADQRKGEIVEELSAAGVIERDTEDDEADDDLRHRRASAMPKADSR